MFFGADIVNFYLAMNTQLSIGTPLSWISTDSSFEEEMHEFVWRRSTRPPEETVTAG